MKITKAKTERLFITRPFWERPIEVKKLELLLDGIKYDRHFGKTRNSDTRTLNLLPRGIETANLRMVTIVSQEELSEVSKNMGVEVKSEDLEANIVLSGMENLTKLPAGTFMKFPTSTILYITSENFPCVVISEHMMERGVEKMTALKVPKLALGKRGLTAMVYAAGFIKVGEAVEIFEPQNFE